MSEIDQSLNILIKAQKTIDRLLEVGSLGIAGTTPANQWKLQPIEPEDKDCNLGFVYIDEIDYGACEAHVHPNAKEYLIVIKGSIMLNIDGADVRILKGGDCGVVFPGQLHYSRPLEDKTKLLYICVPADKGMAQLTKSMKVKI